MAIDPIGSLTTPLVDVSPAVDQTKPDSSGDFSASLTRLIDSVEATGKEANAAVGRMIDGTGDVHEAMIALQRAELSFQLTMQVRNKLVSAYQDIQRMPV
jgi:flagellar hook-basal body complex protein FliE